MAKKQKADSETNVRKPTAEQAAAIGYRGTTCVLSSGAGCGKTTVLTERYLSLLTSDHLGVPQIVAITFTERAAREMRRRIREEIVRRAQSARTDDERDQWLTHQQNLDSAPIQTIHAYCSQILRRYSEEIGRDADVDVLDESAASVLRGEVVQSTLEKLVIDDRPVADDLRELVVLYGWSTVLQSIEKLLTEPDETNWKAFLDRDPEAIADTLLIETPRQLLPKWFDYLQAANAGIAGLFEAMDRVGSPPAAAVKVFADIRQRYAGLATAKALANEIAELHELAKVNRVGTKKQWAHESDYIRMKDALEEFRKQLKASGEAFQLAGTEEVRQTVLRAIDVSRRFLRVALVVSGEYQAEKRKANALDFHDLIALSRNLLRDHEAIRNDLTRQFHAVMVDEFQDTDPTQMEFVTLLCGGKSTPEKLFVVGDEKQSIYRFRGADVDLFRELRGRVPDAGRLSLSTNYRSRPGIIRFVNTLFSRRLTGYEPLKANRPESGHEADVEFLWSLPETVDEGGQQESQQENPQDDQDEVDDDTKESANAIRAREADAIARMILHMQADESFIIPQIKENPPHRVRLSDIVILFRSMSHVAIYENVLRQHGIDYYLVGGRAFFAQQEVYDLLNVLKSIENPLDAPAVVGVLRSPFCGLSDDAITILALHPDGPWAGLFDDARLSKVPADDVAPIKLARQRLTAWREKKDRMPMLPLFEMIFAETGYDASTQFEPLADRKLANLWKLLEFAREFDRTQFGPARFLAQLNDRVSRQPREEQAATRPEEDNVVRLMTIHQAKGLEFPIVFVPDIGSRTKSSETDRVYWHREMGCLVRRPPDIKSTDDEAFSELPVNLADISEKIASWQEDLRLLYVACTRAEERLILSTGWRKEFEREEPTPIPKQGSNHWTMALAERFDLRTGRCLDPNQPAAVSVSMATTDDVVHERPAKPHDNAEWNPAWPGHWSTAAPLQTSLPAWERRQRFFPRQGCDDSLTVISPHLQLIPQPTSLEHNFLTAWMAWTPQGQATAELEALVKSDVGHQLKTAKNVVKDWEWTTPIPGVNPPAVMRGCLPLMFEADGKTWIVGFAFENVDLAKRGLGLMASFVQQLQPKAAISALLFDVPQGLVLPVVIDEKDVTNTWDAIRQSLGV
ncbi:MAG: UvrD-helicase domain-containing protein [Gemmataceae bacterium]